MAVYEVCCAPLDEVGMARSFCCVARGVERSGVESDEAMAKSSETRLGGAGERGKGGP